MILRIETYVEDTNIFKWAYGHMGMWFATRCPHACTRNAMHLLCCRCDNQKALCPICQAGSEDNR